MALSVNVLKLEEFQNISKRILKLDKKFWMKISSRYGDIVKEI